MHIFRIYTTNRTPTSCSLLGVKTIYNDGRTPINVTQTTMAALNWLNDTDIWQFDDGSNILFDDGSTIKIN